MSAKTIKNTDYQVVEFDDNSMNDALLFWTEEQMRLAIEVTTTDNDDSAPYFPQANIEQFDDLILKVEEADVTKFPFNAAGKLYFTFPDGNHMASAQFCGSKQTILTAAHCLIDKDGNTATNVIFKRAYNNGKEAQAIAIKYLVINPKYKNGMKEEDYAFGVTDKESDVSPMDYILDSTFGEAISIGYPTNYYNAKIMAKVTGLYGKPFVDSLGMRGNPFQAGASGGAWINTETNKIVSLNSHIFHNGYLMSGPILDSEFEQLFTYAKSLSSKVVPVDMDNYIRYFMLRNNDGWFVARIRISWNIKDGSGVFEESGYHDICINKERTLDLKGTNIPAGATVKLIAEIAGGPDKEATESFIYYPDSTNIARYEVSGTTLNSDLNRLGIACKA